MNSFEWLLPRSVFIHLFSVFSYQGSGSALFVTLKLFIFLCVEEGLASMTSRKQLVQLFDQNLTKLEVELNSPDFLNKGAAGLILENTI